jgi:hypothetical protein
MAGDNSSMAHDSSGPTIQSKVTAKKPEAAERPVSYD